MSGQFNRSMRAKHSAVVTKATTVTLDNFPEEARHCHAGIELMDVNGVAKTATGGTVTVTIKTVVNPNVAEDVTGGAIDCTSPTTVTWAANTREVIFTPDSITGDATHYVARVTANKS